MPIRTAEAIRARAERAVAERVFPGCVVGVVHSGGERALLPYGTLRYDDDLVVDDTIYDLASVTKSIPLASLALAFIAEKKLFLRDFVKDYLPELRNDRGATIEDLLRYRVRGVRMSQLRHETFEEIRTHALERGFDAPPGESAYTNLPAFVLGLVLERLAGAKLPELAQRYFFEPLCMADTIFFPQERDRVAPTEIVEGEEVCGIVHDESARVFARARHATGHAGLFSTALDLLNFLEALLQGKLPAVERGARKGLGWEVGNRRFMGARASARTFGKTGFTGTSVLVDPVQEVGLVILSNRTYPRRPADQEAISGFRRDVADFVLSS